MATTVDRILARRLATQRLTGATAGVVEVVRELVAAQAQDAPLARWSLGMRTGLGDAAVREVLDSGAVLRTHLLRPTWHFVAAEDLRWLTDLTGAKVLRSLAGRHRVLGLTPAVIGRTHDLIMDLLAGGQYLTRAEIGDRLAGRPGVAAAGEQLGHALMIAEHSGLICSGPLRRTVHTYAVLEERVPPVAAIPREQAIVELTRRFFVGHGPATIAELQRFAGLTKAEITTALAGADLSTTTVAGAEHHHSPGPTRRRTRPRRAFLLPTFDEAFLPYTRQSFPRSARHPRGTEPHSFAEAGGGLVICDLRDVGWWKRSLRGRRAEFRIALDPSLTADRVRAIEQEADRLAAFTGSEAVLRPAG